MRQLLIAATAAVAVAGGAFVASAQDDRDNKTEKQPSQSQGRAKQPVQPPAATQERGRAGAERPAEAAQDRRAKPSPPKAADKAQSDKDKQPATRKAEEPAPKSKSTAEDKGGAPKKSTAEREGQDGSKTGTAERDSKDKKGVVERKSDEPQRKGTAQRKQDEGRGTADAAPGEEDSKRDTSKQAGDSRSPRAELSQEQRTRVRTTIRQQNVRRTTNVNFSIRVGTHVPRTVTLHALPRTVYEVVPYYRGYRYFVVEDRICIVDPASYEIVYVIDDESGPPSRAARLELSASERLFILSHLDLARPSTDVRIGLALGAEIPNRVELLEFPAPVVATVPEVRRYRYVIVDRGVVIVDPDDRAVELVVER